MCGIPMEPPSDAVRGRRLTFEQAVSHIGGMGHLISEDGWRLIDLNRKDYMWKYPGHAWCGYCGADVGDLRAKHNSDVTCPHCGRTVIFKHESRGHARIFDEFCLYEWRRSAIDPETVVLTAAHVWRDSTRDRPEREPLRVHASAIYVFRPGRAVTVYKHHRWHTDDAQYWERVDSVGADHTEYMGGRMDIVMDYGAFLRAIEGTRIGRLFTLLNGATNRRDALELDAIASCARRPWLEYLAKAGQAALAGELMRMKHIPTAVIPNQRARKPAALLGLTEAQWHEVRRDGIRLSAFRLECMDHLRRMGLGDLHMAEVLTITGQGKSMTGYELSILAPSPRRERYQTATLGDVLATERVPEKTRRKIYRRAIRDIEHAGEWRDYFVQLRRLGEDFTDTALILPRDMRAMHQRMIERENAMREETRAQRDAKRAAAAASKYRHFADRRLKKLRREYAFRAHGLMLRPYESAAEVIDEGRALHICIGSYVKRYLEGGTVICCLRREEEPDEPFRAVEFSPVTGKLVQDRGMYNDTRGGIEPGTKKQLELFWKAFERRNA